MNHSDKCLAISFIRPNAEFTLSGDNLEWLDKNQSEPTNAEIEAGFIAYQAAQQAEAEAKEIQRQAILDRLGLTSDEARLLLGS
jgi:hypothetical protein